MRPHPLCSEQEHPSGQGTFVAAAAVAEQSLLLHRRVRQESDDDAAKEPRRQPRRKTNKKKRRRRVSFELEPVQQKEQEQQEQQEDPHHGSIPKALWYSRSELVEMKRAAKRTCIARPDLEFVLNDAYNLYDDNVDTAAPSFKAFSGDSVNNGSATPASIPSSSRIENQELLAQQMLLEIPFFREQRGMERWSSKLHALSRSFTVLKVKTEVYLAQAKKSMKKHDALRHPQLQQTIPNSLLFLPPPPSSSSNNHVIEEASSSSSLSSHDVCLADVCTTASAPAVRFAQLLGRIDAIEATVQHENVKM